MSRNRLRILLFGNDSQVEKCIYVEQILTELQKIQAEIMLNEVFANFIRQHVQQDLPFFTTLHRDEVPDADLAISIGGDGTFLKTAAFLGDRNIPILGINTGHLGFLADVQPENIGSALKLFHEGSYKVEQRSVIEVKSEGAELHGYPFALNEVALLKYDNSSLINVSTRIDGDPLANFLADGLIICTPTGSTGYSLSVGGPIIQPESKSFCISAVAPHSLTVRPVIVTDDVKICLRVKSRSHKFLLSIDGRSETISEKAVIHLRKAHYTVGVMKIMHQKFFDTLRDKMMWGADKRF